MRLRSLTPERVFVRLRRFVRNDQLVLSVLALVVGAVAGGAVVAFREAILIVQLAAFGSRDEHLYIHAEGLAWWWLLAAPAAGGLIVAGLVRALTAKGRAEGVADVIEANALRGGRMSLSAGLAAALVNAVSLGVGASAGREGPAVHLGATFGGWIAEKLHMTRAMSRTLLGCGVAAAVAASFNAPIAGALFANEVVVGHYALRAFAPIVIASVTGTAVSRAYFGDFPAFELAPSQIESFAEIPAFAGLGLTAGLTAVLFMYGIRLVGAGLEKTPFPVWSRPALGGFALGALAIVFPQVLGVGYGATESALASVFPLWLLFALVLAKIAATSISLGCGFGGGVFSPSLVIGAMLGSAYGIVAGQIFPEAASGTTAYAVIGMGAVAAAVLGAPISTTIIIFELTGDYALTVAAMVAVVVASVVTQQLYGRSFFTRQLEDRGLDLRAGFETALLRGIAVRDVMTREIARVTPDTGLPMVRRMLQRDPSGQLFVVRDDGVLHGTVTLADLREAAFDPAADTQINAADVARLHPPALCAADTLDEALKIFRDTGEAHIAVIDTHETETFLGCLHERDLMNAYNRGLIASRREERGV
ncbi:MAG TPA: chloride channel protein [Rhodospirillales bacterium]|nr:chloride channel protein [Rhodospirillales bacterium]